MKSVPAAMTWEILVNGRWHLILGTLISNALPVLILLALERDGGLKSDDPAMLMMHTIFSMVGIMIIGASLLQAQGKLAKLFTYPVSTAELVAWRLLPSMVLITILMALNAAVLNTLFDIDWPIWGPAIFAAAAFAAIEATLWLTDKSAVWIPVAIGIIGGLLGLWFKTRYGGMGAPPDHYWRYVTPAEAITMLAMSVASYLIGVKAVARLRCGEPPFSLGIVDWVTRYCESYTSFRSVPATAFESQCRYELQRKGWLMPASVFLIVVGGVVCWFLTNRDPETLILLFLGMGGGFGMVGVIGGMALGNTGPNDANYGMSSFLATRPISDDDLARAILKTAAVSVLLSWIIWAIAFALICLCLVAAGASQPVAQLAGVSWLVYAASLLGPWVVTGVVASLGFFGRLGAILITLSGLAACIIGFALVNTFISTELRSLLRQSVLIVGPTLVLICTPWLFAVAKRKQLITSSIVSASAAFWIVGVAAVLLFWPSALPFTFIAVVLSLAAVALVVIPLAAAPLALAANRHR